MALDIIFLSYDEPCADLHFEALQKFRPYAKRVTGVKGIREAHIAVAEKAFTSNFFVVDGDTEVIESCHNAFDYKPEMWDKRYVHVWNSINPVNNLIYGYGGVKMFHKDMFKQLSNEQYVDFSTSLGDGVKLMNSSIEHISITHFNSSAYHAWKGAFREVAKLTRALKDQNANRDEINLWRAQWMLYQNPDAPFSQFARLGANAGDMFAFSNDDISPINNNEWLKEQYELSSKQV